MKKKKQVHILRKDAELEEREQTKFLSSGLNLHLWQICLPRYESDCFSVFSLPISILLENQAFLPLQPSPE